MISEFKACRDIANLYFENFQVEVEMQRSKYISRISKCRLRSPRSRNILKSLRLKFSPRDIPKVLWRIEVEVVSQDQIFLEERPVIPGNLI